MERELIKSLIREIAQTVSRSTASGPGSARDELGYAKLSNDKQRQRISNTSFPYTDPDPYEDLEYSSVDSETSEKVSKKNYVAKTMDPGDYAKTDPFYFVAGNTKLSDCFTRADDVLLAVEIASKSMVPLPGTWKTAPKSSGGSASYITLKTGEVGGTKKGWSKPHDKVVIAAEDEESSEKFSIWDILKTHRNNIGIE